MARVPLIEEKEHPELSELIGKIRGARGGRLINIYRLMLHSPALAGRLVRSQSGRALRDRDRRPVPRAGGDSSGDIE